MKLYIDAAPLGAPRIELEEATLDDIKAYLADKGMAVVSKEDIRFAVQEFEGWMESFNCEDEGTIKIVEKLIKAAGEGV